tara:strand:- start:616 stop:4209 length:3594 start_codon:yes stop_codon:yes gene_type:complete
MISKILTISNLSHLKKLKHMGCNVYLNNTKVLIALILVLTSFSFSGTDGTIRGKITDEKGDPLPGQVIVLNEVGDVVTGTSADFDGNYIILNVQVGMYDLKCTMIGFKTQKIQDVSVGMDKTLWLNFVLEESVIEGEEIVVTSEKALVEKGSTSKKITVDQEAIEALPIRNVTELYSLQSGVVKVESGQYGAIPDHEEKGLEEVHVRGGRSGEIAYMIDGLYIRNPIYGGIGNGTRLNLFAVKEFDWQPGGFNAEYGDAMSAVSNMHTNSGQDKFRYKFQYELSPGQQEYDRLRGYNDYNMGFGGKVPLLDKFYYWVSGQKTSLDSYRVLDFDNLVYQENNLGNIDNIANLVAPWDNESGLRSFGFDRTDDIFAKINYDYSSSLKFNLSYWEVHAHRKGFSQRYLYWNEGQNELFRDTKRFTGEINHTLEGGRTFYTIRLSNFIQDQFIGSRWIDNDSDGYPDWFEWRHPSGDNLAGISDPFNNNVVPHSTSNNGDTLFYTRRDGLGPENWTSGWYYGAAPGNYNWESAEDFYDLNGDGIYTPGIDGWDASIHDLDGSGDWTAPEMVESAEYRDGSYWLLPEMYIDFENFIDEDVYLNDIYLDPYYSGNNIDFGDIFGNNQNNEFYFTNWSQGFVFGGHDYFYSESRAETNEIRFDLTSQISDKWRTRVGVDLKSHKLDFYEVKYPWLQGEAKRQRFAEQWDDYGRDGIYWLDFPGDQYDDINESGAWDAGETLLVDYDSDGEYDLPGTPDDGEANGVWDLGEDYDDFNGDNKWNSFVEPMELAMYWQNTFEVPWMVVNAGIRLDGVNYNTKVWSTPTGEFSATQPWFWSDCGQDGFCPDDDDYPGQDLGEADGVWNYNEITSTDFGMSLSEVFFKNSEWLYKVSPRLGFSHVITDQATFTFNYGLYYQTPVYENVYLNTNRQEDPETTFEESEGEIGNATMTASRTQSYEFGFNIQVGQSWAYSIMGWVKDMDQMVTAKSFRSGIYEYQVSSNGDYGSARGIDFTLENRGQLINTMLQYTYSQAKANGDYDAAAFGNVWVDAPSQEYTMPFDRTHDLTLTLYTFLPFGINASLTGFYQSGFPFTPEIMDGDKPREDLLNKYSQRSTAYKTINMSFSKDVRYKDYSIALGLNIYNLLDSRNEVYVYPLTGNANDPGEYYTDEVGIEDGKTLSSAFYDRPWYYSSPREINLFMRVDFR